MILWFYATYSGNPQSELGTFVTRDLQWGCSPTHSLQGNFDNFTRNRDDFFPYTLSLLCAIPIGMPWPNVLHNRSQAGFSIHPTAPASHWKDILQHFHSIQERWMCPQIRKHPELSSTFSHANMHLVLNISWRFAPWQHGDVVGFIGRCFFPAAAEGSGASKGSWAAQH